MNSPSSPFWRTTLEYCPSQPNERTEPKIDPGAELTLPLQAQMFVAAYQDPNSHALRELVADERRACGWSYLSNMDGERRERAFNEFAALVDGHSGQLRDVEEPRK